MDLIKDLIKKIARGILSNELSDWREKVDNKSKELKDLTTSHDYWMRKFKDQMKLIEDLKAKTTFTLNEGDYSEEIKAKGTAIYRSKRQDFSPGNWVGDHKVVRSQTMVYVKKANLKIHQIANTNSMLPTIDGSHEIMVLPKKHFTKDQLKIGDIIVWKKKGKINSVCHRIVKIGSKGFVTQGDNLKMNDGWIKWTEVQSVVVGAVY